MWHVCHMRSPDRKDGERDWQRSQFFGFFAPALCSLTLQVIRSV